MSKIRRFVFEAHASWVAQQSAAGENLTSQHLKVHFTILQNNYLQRIIYNELIKMN